MELRTTERIPMTYEKGYILVEKFYDDSGKLIVTIERMRRQEGANGQAISEKRR